MTLYQSAILFLGKPVDFYHPNEVPLALVLVLGGKNFLPS